MVEITGARVSQHEAATELGASLNFWADPSHIQDQVKKEFHVDNNELPHLDFFNFFIVDGNWDIDVEQVASDRIFRQITDLCNWGPRFSQSESFGKWVEEVLVGNPRKDRYGKPFDTRQSVKDDFEFYLDLIQKMRQSGYVKKSHLQDGFEDTDIGVAIGRGGQLIHFRRGHHRLAIAKQLGLARVAVQVQFIHEEWVRQAIRFHACEEWRAIELGLRTLRSEYDH